MVQVMKVDGEQEMWKRQLSAASTELPSSPTMSRMVSRESDHDVVEFTGKVIDDSVETEFDSLPSRTDSAAFSSLRLVLVPVLCGLLTYGLMNSLIVLILSGVLISVMNGFTLQQAWPKDSDKEVKTTLEDCKEEDEEDIHSHNRDRALGSSSVSRIIGSFYGLCVYASIFACIAAVAILSPWALLILPPVYFCLITYEEEHEEDDDNHSHYRDGRAASSSVSRIISSVYGFCVYASIFGCIAAVAILSPWALLILPPVYICLIAHKEEHEKDGEEKGNHSHNRDGALGSSSVSRIIGSFYGFCVYASIFGCIAAVAILSPWALLILPPVYICLIAHKEEHEKDGEEEGNHSHNRDGALGSSSVSRIIGSFYGFCVCASIFACIAAVAILSPWALLILAPVYICLIAHKEEHEKDGEEKGNHSHNRDGALGSSSVSRIIGSFYGFCVYASIFACIAAVAILSPWALLILPPVYICLIDDHGTEDGEDQDDGSHVNSVAPEVICDWVPSFTVCIYTIVFMFVGVVTIMAILLPAALLFCLKD